MRRFTIYCGGVVLLALSASASASTFTFDKDPFDGTPVLHIPGRQLVGGEEFISFSPDKDVFDFDAKALGLSDPVQFVNATASGIPATGVNIVVLETFDNDNDPLTPFGATNAADLIADRVTTPGPGLFIYFNQNLNLARLVYSADLSDNTADLRVLARMLNLFGDEGKNELPKFTAANFEITNSGTTATAPEPSSLIMLLGAAVAFGCHSLRRKWRIGRSRLASETEA